MNLIRKAQELVGALQSYSQGVDAGEEWLENGGGPVDDETLHTIHVSRQIETSSWAAWNNGFLEIVGSKEDEE